MVDVWMDYVGGGPAWVGSIFMTSGWPRVQPLMMISSQSNIQVWNTYFSTCIFYIFKGFFEPICSDTSDSAEMSYVPLPVPSSFPVLVLRTIRSVPCPSMKFHRFSFFGVESRTMPYVVCFHLKLICSINMPSMSLNWFKRESTWTESFDGTKLDLPDFFPAIGAVTRL